MSSLRRRLLGVTALVMLAFLGATGLALEQAFRQSLEQARQDRLQGVLYTILAAVEVEPEGLALPRALPEARLSTPNSGLYARILDDDGLAWQSPSLLGHGYAPLQRLGPGESRYYDASADGEPLHALAYGLSWEDAESGTRHLTVHVAEAQSGFAGQLGAYRRHLWSGLGAAAGALLLVQLLILHWSLRPLQKVAADLHEIVRGRADYLDGRYPAEILPLTSSLNTLLRSERSRAGRYRDTLANLAHSIKTPLAVVRQALEREPEALEQLDRIDTVVAYQLRRAAAGGHEALAAPLPVRPVLERLLRGLAKAYWEKSPAVALECDQQALFYGSEGDLMELLGNLLDNAFKWTGGQVRVALQPLPGEIRDGLRLTVEDDGPGVPQTLREHILARGARADEQVPGHGIGLAVVQELARSYGGELRVGGSELGGARFELNLPPQ